MASKSNTSSTSSNAITIKGMLVYQTEIRKNNQGSRYGISHFVTSNDVYFISFPEQFIDEMDQDKFYILKNVYNSPDGYRLKSHSEIFSTKPCAINNTALQLFKNAPVVSIPDAVSSPTKRRFSVCGFIQHIGEVYSGENSRRKLIRISTNSDPDTNEPQAHVKLWNQHCENSLQTKQKITLKNVVSEFNGVKTINTTSTTQIIDSTEETRISGEIQGINWKTEVPKVLINDISYTIETDLLKTVMTKYSVDGITVDCKVIGNSIREIKKMAKEKTGKK